MILKSSETFLFSSGKKSHNYRPKYHERIRLVSLTKFDVLMVHSQTSSLRYTRIFLSKPSVVTANHSQSKGCTEEETWAPQISYIKINC